jgi:hypothetical protein
LWRERIEHSQESSRAWRTFRDRDEAFFVRKATWRQIREVNDEPFFCSGPCRVDDRGNSLNVGVGISVRGPQF